MTLEHRTAYRQQPSPSERPLVARDRIAAHPASAGPKLPERPLNCGTLDRPNEITYRQKCQNVHVFSGRQLSLS